MSKAVATVHTLRPSMASALCYGCITSIASLALDHGVQVELLVIVRGIVVALVCAPLLAIRHESLNIGRMGLANLLFLSVAIVLTSFFQLTAIKYISVGLTVLLFFTFPILVALLDFFRRRSLVPSSIVALSVVAFAGVGFAIGPEFDQLGLARCGVRLPCGWRDGVVDSCGQEIVDRDTSPPPRARVESCGLCVGTCALASEWANVIARRWRRHRLEYRADDSRWRAVCRRD